MTVLGIIPARYASTRLPAKALADIGGKSMIQRVYEQALKAASLSKVVVATDHELIFNHVKSFGGEVCLTSPEHASGTDRCAEAWRSLNGSFNYVINIQGDEPFIRPEQIDLLVSGLTNNVQLATLIKKIDHPGVISDPNVVKVIFNKNNEALYFSREALPHVRGEEKADWINKHTYYKHIGIYAYHTSVLEEITKLQRSSLEVAESLEQLRWLENGYKINVIITRWDCKGIDTPEDLKSAIEMVHSEKIE